VGGVVVDVDVVSVGDASSFFFPFGSFGFLYS